MALMAIRYSCYFLTDARVLGFGFDALVWSWWWHSCITSPLALLIGCKSTSPSPWASSLTGRGWSVRGSSKHRLVPSRRHFQQGLSQNGGGKRSRCFFFSFLGGGCRLVSEDGRERGRHAEHAHRVREQILRIWRCAAPALLQGEDGGYRRLLPEKQRHLDRHLPQVRSVSARVSHAPCTLHVHLSLREKSSSRIMMKANVFLPPSPTLIMNFTLFLCCNWRPSPIFICNCCRSLSADIAKIKCWSWLNTHWYTRHIISDYAPFVGFSVTKNCHIESRRVNICFSTLAPMFTSADSVAQFPRTARRVGLVTWRAWLANGGWWWCMQRKYWSVLRESRSPSWGGHQPTR